MTLKDLKDFTTTTIEKNQMFTKSQENLQRHKCSAKCRENSTQRCKDYPAFYIRNDINLKKSKSTIQSIQILKDYRLVVSEICNFGHDFEKLEDLTEDILLSKLECNYNDYLYAISTTVRADSNLFFKRNINELYVVPHNVEATLTLNATTHSLICNSLRLAVYITKYRSNVIYLHTQNLQT